MCQSKVQSEEIFLNQNSASGGKNSATVEEFKFHLSAISIVLMVICTILFLGFMYIGYRLYKKCHQTWMRDQLTRHVLRRSDRTRHYRSPGVPVICEDCNCRATNSCKGTPVK